MCIIGAGYKTPLKTITMTHTFLGGDSTNAVYIDTQYYQLPEDFSGFRFIKTFYQSPSIDSAGLGGCTSWVDIQTGLGNSPGGYWNNIVTYVITDESTFATSGYDLVKVWAVDSALSNIRLRFRIQSDSAGVTPVNW